MQQKSVAIQIVIEMLDDKLKPEVFENEVINHLRLLRPEVRRPKMVQICNFTRTFKFLIILDM